MQNMDYDRLRNWADREDLLQHAIAYALVDIAESLDVLATESLSRLRQADKAEGD